MKKLLFVLGALLAGIVTFLVLFYVRFGGSGQTFTQSGLTPTMNSTQLEVVATLPEPPGNLAVSASGRIFFTYHAESRPDIKVLELVNGVPTPYPNPEMQTYSADRPSFDAIFNVRIDSKNRLWTLDHGFHGLKKPRLMAFDLKTNQLVQDYVFPKSIVGAGSYIQDMQIDSEAKRIYIADIGVLSDTPSLIVYDIENKAARRLLVNHPALRAEPYTINSKGRRMILLGGLFWMHPGFDPIAIDRKNEWLYVGPMSGKMLYRVKTHDLNNLELSQTELNAKVEPYAERPQCDGLTIDDADNIYVTGIEEGAIYRIGSDRKLTKLIEHPQMRWPDGLSFGPNGYIYIADSDIPDVMLKSKEHIKRAAPFYIWRFQSGNHAIAGQ